MPALSYANKKGFTLVELLVVISIIAILSVIGITVFTGVQKGARDSKRKGDINAITKAYEVKYNNTGSYGDLKPDLQENIDLFASKQFPKDPKGGSYAITQNPSSGGFRVCTTLEDNTSFCKGSIQEDPPPLAGGTPETSKTITAGTGDSSSTCPTTSLVTHWKMEDNWQDAQGTNHGTPSGGPTFAAGKSGFGKAGSFNGTGAYVIVPDSSSLRISAYTVSAWIKPTPDNDYWTGIVGKPGRNFNMWLGSSNNSAPGFIHHRFHSTASANDGCPNASGIPIDGSTWTHVVLTNNGSTCKTYVNGAEKASGPVNGSLIVDNTALQIGRNLDGGASNYYRGLIDDIRVYNQALSPQEVTSLFSCTP